MIPCLGLLGRAGLDAALIAGLAAALIYILGITLYSKNTSAPTPLAEQGASRCGAAMRYIIGLLRPGGKP